MYIPYNENIEVVVQYDEHLSKTIGQWHAKEAFGRRV
jgi:hypothetical protein